MINIYTTQDRIEELTMMIKEEHRLIELVTIFDLLEIRPKSSALSIIVDSQGIKLPLDWANELPPYLLPEALMMSKNTLLGLIYIKLGNFERGLELLKDHSALLAEVDFIRRLQLGLTADPSQLAVETYQEYDDYRLMHNNAIVRLYSTDEPYTQPAKVDYYFKESIASAPNEEYKAWSSIQYFTFLLDTNRADEARQLLTAINTSELSKAATTECDYNLCKLDLFSLSPPYDLDKLNTLKDRLWSCLVYYEKNEQHVMQALCLMDAAQIANITDSFAESLGYYSKAISIFGQENLDEFVNEAHLKKANLLLSWAQKGHPQFYKPAMEAYQKATKLYSKEDFPVIYGEIQEKLGIIYAQVPDEAKKKSIWAAVSSSSFKEALSIFDKSSHPYEYARVCNHYANALIKYPAAVLSDNLEKSLFYYSEALDIRDSDSLPLERSLTLLNYIEACWFIQQDEDHINESQHLSDMENKIQEVIALNVSEELVNNAREHKEKLEELKKILQTN